MRKLVVGLCAGVLGLAVVGCSDDKKVDAGPKKDLITADKGKGDVGIPPDLGNSDAANDTVKSLMVGTWLYTSINIGGAPNDKFKLLLFANAAGKANYDLTTPLFPPGAPMCRVKDVTITDDAFVTKPTKFSFKLTHATGQCCQKNDAGVVKTNDAGVGLCSIAANAKSEWTLTLKAGSNPREYTVVGKTSSGSDHDGVIKQCNADPNQDNGCGLSPGNGKPTF